MNQIINLITNNKNIQLLVIFIVLDVIFGVLRSAKEHKMNSTIGIDGIIRKTGMLITIVVTLILDKICGINLIAFVPEELRTYVGIDKCGITLLFNSLYIVFESLSILKNMKRCGIPFPKRLNNFLEKLLSEFTSEVKNDRKSGETNK